MRAHRSLWLMLCLAVLAAGSLSSAFAAPTGPVTGLRVALSGVVLLVTFALAVRVLAGIDRARRRADTFLSKPSAESHGSHRVHGRSWIRQLRRS